MRAGVARAVILYLKHGASLEEAFHESISDLRRLKCGYLGPVIVHALAPDGSHYAVQSSDSVEHNTYWVWTDVRDTIEELIPTVDKI